MKMYSDSAITREQVEKIAQDHSNMASMQTAQLVSGVDEKQTLQIKQLRVLIALSFICNLIITLAGVAWAAKHL